MIQIIDENKRPSRGQMFAQAIGGLAQGASQAASAYYGSEAKKAAKKKQSDYLSKYELQDLEDPELIKVALGQKLKGENEEQKLIRQMQMLRDFARQNQQGRQGMGVQGMGQQLPMDPAMMQRMMMEGTMQPNQINQQFQGQQPDNGYGDMGGYDQTPNQGNYLDNLSDDQLNYLSLINPNLANTATKNREFQYKKEKDIESRLQDQKKEVRQSYVDNKDYISKVRNKYEDTLAKEARLDRMNQLDEEGELSPSSVINLLESLGLQSEWLQNPANEEYNKLSLDLLGGGSLQADYGNRILASEFKIAQQRIPSLMQTSEGRRQIVENYRAMLLPSILKQKRLQHYINKAEKEGKPLPNDLEGKVLQDIRPQLKKVYDDFKQRNGRYKVKKNTAPNDNAIEKYYFIANGDAAKAKKLMREDGYDVK